MRIVPETMKQRLLVYLTLFLSAAAAFSAELRTVAEYNFAIDVPEWWESISPAPPGSVFAVHSAKKDRSVVVIASRVKPSEQGTKLVEIIVDVRKQLEATGFTIKGEEHVESNGVAWTAIAASGPPNTDSVLWVHLTADQLYLMRADNLVGGKVTDDAELQAVMRSFHFLAPGEAEKILRAARRNTSDDALSATVYFIGTLGIFAIVAVIILPPLVRALSKKKKTKRWSKHR